MSNFKLKIVPYTPSRGGADPTEVDVGTPATGTNWRLVGIHPVETPGGSALACVFDNSDVLAVQPAIADLTTRMAIVENTVVGGAVVTDTISEATPAAGVTADGVLLKDSQVNTDQINEKTGAAGVTIDGVLLKDSQVNTDQINEKTGAAGVTIDSVLLKDGKVNSVTIRPTETVIEIPATANTAVTKYAPAASARTVSAIDVWTDVIASVAGTVKLTVKKQPANVTMLVAADYDLEVPVDKALTALALTATGADLALLAGDWIEAVVTSDNLDMTGGENLKVIVVF